MAIDPRELEEVFDEARHVTGSERRAVLDARCAGRDELRREVESLLEYHDSVGVFLDEPVGRLEESAVSEHGNGAGLPAIAQPDRVGDFRILDILGAGGMGVVYRAEQERPRRTVALKMIRPGVASASLLRRFEHETELLARLQHPGIAQIYEAGTADAGGGAQPYFAMELVEGPAVLRYAAERALSVSERLELLARVCDAVQHAHMRGVIHRDLKPGNILVQERLDTGTSVTMNFPMLGQPKILDFGVARAIDSDIRTTTMQMNVGQLIGTLAYMSPEQCTGDPTLVDARSDVYALGVIGYELLAGRLPLDLEGSAIHEAIRVIREDDPTPLSSVDRVYRGDIDTIIGKALEKDKGRRYQTAAELSADLRRHLGDEPITARPPSTIYHLRKFVQRNTGLVAGIAGVFVMLVLGIIGTTWQMVQANDARDDAQKQLLEAEAARREADAANEFLRDMLASASPSRGYDADITVRDLLRVAAADLDERFTESPEVEARVREAIGGAFLELDSQPEGEEQFAEVRRLREQLHGPDDSRTLDAANREIAAIIRQNRFEDGESLAFEARRRCEALLGEGHPVSIRAVFNIGLLRHLQQRFDEAAEHMRIAAERYASSLGEADDRTIRTRGALGVVLMDAGKIVEAEEVLAQIVAKQTESLGPEHPSTLSSKAALAEVIRSLQRFDESVELWREIVAARERLFTRNNRLYILTLRELADSLHEAGQLDEAVATLRELSRLSEEVLGIRHRESIRVERSLARLLTQMGRLSEAEEIFRELLPIIEEPGAYEFPDIVNVKGHYANVLYEQEKYEESAAINREMLAEQVELFGEEHPNSLAIMNNLAASLLKLEALAEAETLLRKSVDLETRVLGTPKLGSRNNLGRVLQEQGKLEEADAIFRQLVIDADAALPDGHWLLGGFRMTRGHCLLQMGRYDEAEALFRSAIEILHPVFGDDHRYMRRALTGLAAVCDATDRRDEAAEYRARVESSHQESDG